MLICPDVDPAYAPFTVVDHFILSCHELVIFSLSEVKGQKWAELTLEQGRLIRIDVRDNHFMQ